MVATSAPEPNRGINLSEAEATEHLKDKYVQMIRREQAAGREIPAVPVSQSAVGEELARTSVEASQRSMRLANRRVFIIPALPWQRPKGA